jgi:hypothetical protein
MEQMGQTTFLNDVVVSRTAAGEVIFYFAFLPKINLSNSFEDTRSQNLVFDAQGELDWLIWGTILRNIDVDDINVLTSRRNLESLL